MYKVYGISNCDTVKKAIQKLKSKDIDYEFIDFKKNPPTLFLLQKWFDQKAELPVNKKGPTFRKIKDEFENVNLKKQMQLLIENSSAIKRPIIEKANIILMIGFDDRAYDQLK